MRFLFCQELRCNKLKTFQDFEKAEDVKLFLLPAIREYKDTPDFEIAETAQSYYANENTAIGHRMGYLERQMRSKVKVKFHKLRNGFFPYAVRKLVMYLMGNGATLDDEIKKSLDPKFDNKMNIGTINACVDGVVWGMPDIDDKNRDILVFFRANMFVPLLDERTSKLRAGIYFWQLSKDKPLNITLFEADGITEFVADNNGSKVEETIEKRNYKQNIRRDGFSTTVIGGENYIELPIYPLYADDLMTSLLTPGLQALIDAYDFISSDLVDGITLLEGLYGIVKNYAGQDAQELLAEIHQLKILMSDGQDASADVKTIEIPYEAKQMALELLEKRMYADFPLPESANSGRAVTATEIKAAREDMDIKADLLEWQVAEFIENILRLKGNDTPISNYKRRTNNNDTETVTNISTQIMGGWITKRMAITLDPTIPEDAKEKLILEVDLEDTSVPLDGEELEGEEVTGAEVSQEAEQVTGKTLTGIQTTSLIGVIEKLKEGSLTIGQAINIVSISIGVTKEEAKRIIEGLD